MVIDVFRDVFFRLHFFLWIEYSRFSKKRKIDHLHFAFCEAILRSKGKKGEQTFISHPQTHFRTSLEICELAFCEAIRINSSQLLRQHRFPARCGTHSLCFVLRGSRWFAVVWGWELTCLSRLSHDDGTFTQGKLPQIRYYILYIIDYILQITYYV